MRGGTAGEWRGKDGRGGGGEWKGARGQRHKGDSRWEGGEDKWQRGTGQEAEEEEWEGSMERMACTLLLVLGVATHYCV